MSRRDLTTTSLQIQGGILQWKNCENRLRFDRNMATSLWSHFFWPTLYVCMNIREYRSGAAADELDTFIR